MWNREVVGARICAVETGLDRPDALQLRHTTEQRSWFRLLVRGCFFGASCRVPGAVGLSEDFARLVTR
jgi:hypothetical protein